ncbi:MAG TPA: response regulator transcription factor, partial [Candidatus Limnocylindria bacterium]|nr:response regulator transcription factor [Candidatus Limnocylindria bacterium]
MRNHAATHIRVVVADDHPSIRENLRYLLNAEADMRVVGVASDGAEALTVASDALPDVLVLDHDMPGLDGLAVMRRLRTDHPGIAVVMYTAQPEMCDDAMNAGAAGCVGKDESPALLLDTIRNAAAGLALGDLRRNAAGALPHIEPLEVAALARAIEAGQIEAYLQP